MESNPRKLLDEFIPEAMGKQFVIVFVTLKAVQFSVKYQSKNGPLF